MDVPSVGIPKSNMQRHTKWSSTNGPLCISDTSHVTIVGQLNMIFEAWQAPLPSHELLHNNSFGRLLAIF